MRCSFRVTTQKTNEESIGELAIGHSDIHRYVSMLRVTAEKLNLTSKETTFN